MPAAAPAESSIAQQVRDLDLHTQESSVTSAAARDLHTQESSVASAAAAARDLHGRRFRTPASSSSTPSVPLPHAQDLHGHCCRPPASSSSTPSVPLPHARDLHDLHGHCCRRRRPPAPCRRRC
jgi:hypothetical protein